MPSRRYKIKIKDLPKLERPREKLAAKGSKALRRDELLAIILRSGYKGKNVLALAKSILKLYPRNGLTQVDYHEIRKLPGVGPSRAAQIVASFELARRMIIKPKEEEIFIKLANDVVKETENIRKNKKENFICLYLDARNKLIYKETISIGSLNANVVHPREVFQPAVEHSAAAVIFVHNHPSGDPQPSRDDKKLTKRLVEAGKIMGIEVLDHVIIGNKDYLSMKEKNLI